MDPDVHRLEGIEDTLTPSPPGLDLVNGEHPTAVGGLRSRPAIVDQKELGLERYLRMNAKFGQPSHLIREPRARVPRPRPTVIVNESTEGLCDTRSVGDRDHGCGIRDRDTRARGIVRRAL
jgi:hypothetical protein